MSENIQEFLHNTIGILTFILAVSLFVFIQSSAREMNDIFNKSNQSDRVVYESKQKIEEIRASGAEIIYQIYQGLEYDIVVNNILIDKDIDKDAFDYLSIHVDQIFKKEIKIDGAGKIMKVVYN